MLALGDTQSVELSVPVVSRWLWPRDKAFLEVASMMVTWWIVDFYLQPVFKKRREQPVFKKRREVLFWGPLPYPPSPRMFCLISRLLLKLAF